MKKGFLLILSLLLLGSPMKAQHFLEEGSGRIYLDKWLYLFPKNIEGFKSAKIETWDTTHWNVTGKMTHSGGTNNAPAKLLWENWDGINWAQDSMFYTFENGRIKRITTLPTNDGIRFDYTYGVNGKLEKTLLQFPKNGIWLNQDLDSNIYSAAGHVNLTYRQRWDSIQWKNDMLDTLAYNANGKLVFVEWRRWFFNEYIPGNRYHYSYDASGNRTGIRLEAISNWNTVDTIKRVTMSYDAQGRMTLLSTQYHSNGSWHNGARVHFLLNNEGKVLRELYEMDSVGTWANYQRTTYSYTTGTDEVILDKNFFEVSPNPVQNGRLHVQAKDKTSLMRNIELYDINGRLIMQQNIDNQWVANIETAGLMNGLHVLKIKTDNGVSIQKVMIQQ